MRFISIVFIATAYAVGCHGASPTYGAPTQAASPTPLSISGDAARGKSRAGELYCDACHGPNGNSETTEWPSLAGQNPSYFRAQLELLRSGARPSAEMQPMAVPLSDQDIADLAAHYSIQTAATTATAGESAQVGESLYLKGDSARGIAACISCHGAKGEGNSVTGDPAVRAQQPGYVIRQLEAYAKRTRYAPGLQDEAKSANLEIMQEISQKLSPEEISSLASYLHALR